MQKYQEIHTWKLTQEKQYDQLYDEPFTEREPKTAIFFDIEKTDDIINKNKTFEKLKNMGMQERMMEFIKELIRNKQTKHRGYTVCDSLSGCN